MRERETELNRLIYNSKRFINMKNYNFNLNLNTFTRPHFSSNSVDAIEDFFYYFTVFNWDQSNMLFYRWWRFVHMGYRYNMPAVHFSTIQHEKKGKNVLFVFDVFVALGSCYCCYFCYFFCICRFVPLESIYIILSPKWLLLYCIRICIVFVVVYLSFTV